MKFKNIFKRKVNDFQIKCILIDFIKPIQSKIVIYFEITNRGVIKLYTNRPGYLIGKAGKDIKMLTNRLKNECNAKDVKIFEIKNLVSNCGLY